MEVKETNLITYNLTFPKLVDPIEIITDSKISALTRRFNKDNHIVIVEGPYGSGKTTLLSQFVRTNKNNCFSYFFSDNYWTLRPTFFLSSLCQQMYTFLGTTKDIDSLNQYSTVDFEKLKRIFEGLVQKVVVRIIETNSPCYFVIDGLENVFNFRNDNDLVEILNLPTNSRGLFYLGSVSSSCSSKLPFHFLVEEPHYFSISETTNYFSKTKVLPKQIEEIQKWSGGIPGLLMLAKDLLTNSDKSVDQIVNEPKNLEKLIEAQWSNIIDTNDELLQDILSVITYSIVPLDIESLSKILINDLQEIEKKISRIGFIKQTEDCCYSFYPDAYKNYCKIRMQKTKNETILKLINFYKNTDENSAKVLLPQYLGIIEDYENLKKLLTPEYLSSLVIENNDITLAETNINNSLDLAKRQQDIGAIKFGLAGAQLHEISNQIFEFSEVIALIELKQFDQALNLAYSTNILSNRIRLLSKIYLAMDKVGFTVPRKGVDELNILATQLSNEQGDPEVILTTAADLFPILPNIAISMVDQVKRSYHGESPIELFALMTSITSESQESDTLLSKISDDNIRDYAISHSPWLTSLTANEVINKATELKNTKAKEYLLRHWCIENPKSPGIELVLNRTLDIIMADNDYHIPLRNLRQLSDFIMNCPFDKIPDLIQRFEIPLFSSLQVPIQEKIRLELNFAESMYLQDNQEGEKRLKQIQEKVCESDFDIDVVCVCLSSLLATIYRIDPNDKLRLRKCLTDRFETEYLRLLENSASQLDITKRVLRIIAKINFNLALALSDLLNTIERRDVGTQEVLTSYLQQDNCVEYKDVVHKGLERIIDNKKREATIKKIVELLTSTKRELNITDVEFLLSIISIVEDPIIKTTSYSCLLTRNLDNELSQSIFDKLIDTWEEIDISWVRIECAFDIVGNIAEKYPILGQDLFDRAKSLKNSTSLANQSLGYMYFETIRHAAKLYGKIIKLHNFEELRNQLEVLLYRIPSSLLQLRVFGDIALSLIRNGYKNEADLISQEKIIPGLQKCGNSFLKSVVISDIAVVLYEYSPEVAIYWVKTIPYIARNVTWLKIIVRLLTQSYMCDQYDDEAPVVSINLQVANHVLKIINQIERDNEVYQAVKIFSRAIADDSAKLSENQKIDLLNQIESIVNEKLPDTNNIIHPGYQVLCLAEIETAKWKSAKHLKKTLPKNAKKIIANSQNITNIADRVLVLGDLGVLFQYTQNVNTSQLLNDAFTSINEIRNIKDRFDRLEILADCFGKTRNTSMVSEIMRMGVNIADSLDGVEKDQVLASLIQSTYQFNKTLASELSERIEDHSTHERLSQNQKAQDLSKSPQKICSYTDNQKTSYILNTAAKKMNKMIASGRNISIIKSTILDWISSIKRMEYSECNEVINWVIQSFIMQASESEDKSVSEELFLSFLDCCKLILLLGGYFSNVTNIPEDLKENFQGYLPNRKIIKIGEKDKAKTFIAKWIKENANTSILICDPYFDEEQLWILRMIPNNIIVKILCTLKGFGYERKNNSTLNFDKATLRNIKNEIKDKIMKKWIEISDQDPPNTIVIIQNTIFNDEEIHDRFILSKEFGISIGGSLNTFGKKEVFISTLPFTDVTYILDTYVNPKIRLDEDFTSIIFFQLE